MLQRASGTQAAGTSSRPRAAPLRDAQPRRGAAAAAARPAAAQPPPEQQLLELPLEPEPERRPRRQQRTVGDKELQHVGSGGSACSGSGGNGSGQPAAPERNSAAAVSPPCSARDADAGMDGRSLAAGFARELRQHTAGAGDQAAGAAAEAAEAADARWARLLAAAQRLAPGLEPRQASLVLYSCAKAGRPLPGGIVERLGPPELAALPAAGLTNTLWALAVLQLPPGPSWLGGFYEAAASRLHAPDGLNRHQLASVLWSLGRLAAPPPAEWLAALLAALRPQLARLGPSELANCVWALAQLRFRPGKAWERAWLAAAAAALPRCGPDHLACIAGSLGRLRLRPHGRWQVELRRAAARQLPALRARHAATLLCGLAKLYSRQPPHWVELLIDRQLQLAAAAAGGGGNASGGASRGATASAAAARPSAGDLAATVWALPRLLYPTPAAWARQPRNAERLRRLAAAALPLLPGCSVQQLVQLAVGFAALRHYPGAHWLKVHENAVAARHGQLSAANRTRLRAAMRALWLDG